MSSLKEAFGFPFELCQMEPYVCSYLEGMSACSQVVVPAHLVDTQVYSKLVYQGFRRSGLFVYRPLCQECHACTPLRILVAAFSPDRSQKRVWHHLSGVLHVRVMDLHFAQEHYQLYQNYQQKRHAGGEMDNDSQAQYEQFLLRSHVNSCLIEYRELTADNQFPGMLKMVSIIDTLRDGISAVYTFYDPHDRSAGYGTYGILWQIQYAKTQMLPYVYLGYWVQDCPKMSYKIRFKPCEVLTEQGWVTKYGQSTAP